MTKDEIVEIVTNTTVRAFTDTPAKTGYLGTFVGYLSVGEWAFVFTIIAFTFSVVRVIFFEWLKLKIYKEHLQHIADKGYSFYRSGVENSCDGKNV